MKSTEGRESPQSYFYWSMLTAISSVIGKKLYVNRGGVYKLYPNIYTFLISKKSGLRKGVPVDVAKKLAHEIGKVRVIDGQNSIQGVLKELAKVRTVGNGHIIKNAEGFLISGEFASFILQDGVGFSLTTLTDLYDTQYHEKNFKKTLATQDEIELKSPCLCALFASNETHFFNTVPQNAISGGFLARTFCIYEERKQNSNSLTGHSKPIPNKIDYLKVLSHLSNISQLEGEIIATPKANELFDEWYYDFDTKLHDDDTGTSERLGDNIWKAAMLISLGNSHQMIIEEEDMEEAIMKGMETFTNLKRLLLGGPSDSKNVKSLTMRTVVACIIETDPEFKVSRKKILRKGAGIFGVYDLDETIEHLMQAGMIKIEKVGSEQYYKFTELMINRHKEIQSKSEE